MHIAIRSYPPFLSATCLQHARFEDVHDASVARAYIGRQLPVLVVRFLHGS